MDISKRLTVVNDGFTKRDNIESASVRMLKVRARYIDKMEAKGWILQRVTAGNAGDKWESYVHMSK
tara:strand:- start:6163 stop:6360 length:198 start_codon:yes stop_codon:yes gene_type:complete